MRGRSHLVEGTQTERVMYFTLAACNMYNAVASITPTRYVDERFGYATHDHVSINIEDVAKVEPVV